MIASRRLIWRQLLPLIAAPSVALAQATGATPTLGDVIRSLDAASRLGNLATANPLARRILDSVSVALQLQGVADRSVNDVARATAGAGAPSVTPAVVLRVHRAERTVLFQQGVRTLIALGNTEINDALDAQHVPRAQKNLVLAPFDSLVTASRNVAQIRNLAVLRNFERKYGPGSPSLNLLEVGLNYAAQFVPPFRTTETSGPSPLEIIASYGTTSLAVGATKQNPPKLVSNARFGLRSYIFRDGWGEASGWRGYLHPAHASSGLMTMGPEDEALDRAWGRGYRAGPFVGWGDLYAGYLVGPRHRFIAGLQKQLVSGVL